ncbi:protein PAL OF QUIRKY [Salvia miltiorrhiza]|uniref:protein PAL OF QUIRKY n=1 Tax=Salvia miltiorrhiza TaxID=226208 RepID=UPI0025ABFE57|nr:protein PAL OF QUIRKY [Salvia miltiorrhiza]
MADLDSNPADSLASTPRSDLHDDALQPRVRFMCSFGGKILPRPHDNQLRYFGGDTRIVAVHRHTTFAALLSKLSKFSGTTNISIKYQLPNEDLDALITVTADEDVENMMEEYDRLSQSQKSARLRLFLFPIDDSINDSRASSINSLLDGSAKRENWFVDVLNGGPAAGSVLERGRSEVSSIVSEVPDYLFGLDNSDDALKDTTKIRNKNLLNDNVSMSDPGSPAPVVSSPFCSTSSSLAPPNLQMIPDLPPVKTRPINPVQAAEHKESEVVHEKMGPQPTGYSGGPVWHYPNPQVQPMPAMYYMPGSHVQAANASVPQQVPIRAQFLQSYPVSAGQVPMGFPGMNHVYGAGVRPYEMPARFITDTSGQPVYYGARNVAVVPGSYPGMGVPGGEEAQGSGSDMMAGRISQGS